MTREGVDELIEYLSEDTPSLSLEQAMFKTAPRTERVGSAAGGSGVSDGNTDRQSIIKRIFFGRLIRIYKRNRKVQNKHSICSVLFICCLL